MSHPETRLNQYPVGMPTPRRVQVGSAFKSHWQKTARVLKGEEKPWLMLWNSLKYSKSVRVSPRRNLYIAKSLTATPLQPFHSSIFDFDLRCLFLATKVTFFDLDLWCWFTRPPASTLILRVDFGLKMQIFLLWLQSTTALPPYPHICL